MLEWPFKFHCSFSQTLFHWILSEVKKSIFSIKSTSRNILCISYLFLRVVLYQLHIAIMIIFNMQIRYHQKLWWYSNIFFISFAYLKPVRCDIFKDPHGIIQYSRIIISNRHCVTAHVDDDYYPIHLLTIYSITLYISL